MRLILEGDALEVLSTLEEASVDSVVTDPPYGIAFIGKHWDRFEPKEFQEWNEKWLRECLRVLKPGGHVLAFGAPRLYGRLQCAAEDAGFEMRDTLAWLYGTGFPKGQNLGDGWKTGLKPGLELICMGRKPLSEKTVKGNMKRWGVGGLNIDGCRIEVEGEQNPSIQRRLDQAHLPDRKSETVGFSSMSKSHRTPNPSDHLGRYPANVTHDGSEEVLEGFPETESDSRLRGESETKHDPSSYKTSNISFTPPGDKGSAARIFYNSGKAEGRFPANVAHDGSEEVLGNFPITDSMKKDMPSYEVKGEPTAWDFGFEKTGGYQFHQDVGSAARIFYCSKASRYEREEGLVNFTGGRKNKHPTVKPIKLMRWLIRLVTPKGGIVLDPFLGSGTTACAALEEKCGYIGIERENEYLQIAKSRIFHYARKGTTEQLPI